MLDRLTELIRRTTSDLPPDVEAALARAARAEPADSRAALCLNSIAENVCLARGQSSPLCQDTGMPTFFWTVPRGTDTLALGQAAQEAVNAATAKGWLRQSATGNIPVCHFEQADTSAMEVSLLLKGGGSENVSCQFSLPDETLDAGRDLEGVRKCILHAVWQAQGYGCAPGILGVCIGADRGEGFHLAKKQLLRPLSDESPEPGLAALERRVLDEANQLGIGPMGMGGQTTLLGVKIITAPRLPASYFVTIAYSCWACRRHTLRF